MRMKIVSGLAALAAGAVASAPAAAEPFAFGHAERGSLRVVSVASVAARSAELRGVWLDENVGCDQFRSLRVGALIDFSRGSTTRTIRRGRVGAVRNCAEGGPNFGFTITARAAGLACPNGRWRPGFYSFVTRTTHRATRISALVSLAWENRSAC